MKWAVRWRHSSAQDFPVAPSRLLNFTILEINWYGWYKVSNNQYREIGNKNKRTHKGQKARKSNILVKAFIWGSLEEGSRTLIEMSFIVNKSFYDVNGKSENTETRKNMNLPYSIVHTYVLNEFLTADARQLMCNIIFKKKNSYRSW